MCMASTEYKKKEKKSYFTLFRVFYIYVFYFFQDLLLELSICW